MSRNKLYNQGYFVKRLVDAGFDVTRLGVRFEKNDYRRWMILVNARGSEYKHNICITCFKNRLSEEFMFKFQGQNECDFSYSTKSMNTIIEFLRKVFSND